MTIRQRIALVVAGVIAGSAGTLLGLLCFADLRWNGRPNGDEAVGGAPCSATESPPQPHPATEPGPTFTPAMDRPSAGAFAAAETPRTNVGEERAPRERPVTSQPPDPPPSRGGPDASGRLAMNLGPLWTRPSEEAWAAEGIRGDERTTIEEIIGASRERLRAQVQPLYVEIGGDPAEAARFTVEEVLREMFDKSVPEERRQALSVVAGERLGTVPCTGGSPWTRMTRLMYEESDRLTAEVERILGPERGKRFLEGTPVRR